MPTGKSRYYSQGKLPGILCLVSSKKYPGQFTDVKMEEAEKEIREKGKTTIYIYDKRVWDIKPNNYSKTKFKVFVGDEFRKPRIVGSKDQHLLKDKHLIIEVPEDFRIDFERDIVDSLREIAGVSHVMRHPFFSDGEALYRCFRNDVKSVFSLESTDFETDKLEIIKSRIKNPDIERWAHIDLGKTADAAGLAIGHVPQFLQMKRASGTYEYMPVIRMDGVLQIRPPRHGEILFWKIRKILYLLRELGMNLKWVSFDSWQSYDSQQLLRQKGFTVGEQSMDTTTGPYDFTKTAVQDGRLHLPHHAVAKKEMTEIQRDMKTLKIDHMPHGCFTADTRVALADGSCPTFEELTERYGDGGAFYVYSVGADGLCITRACNPRLTKTASSLVEVQLDNFQVVRCTPDHLFMTIEREWVQAQHLTPAVRLMPLYRTRAAKGGWADYEYLWCPIRRRSLKTHHVAFGKRVPPGFIIHHKDRNKGNNDPRNLALCTREDHVRDHARELWSQRRAAMRLGFRRYFSDWRNREKSRQRIKLTWVAGKLGAPRSRCCITNCPRLADAKGLCDLHYQRMRRMKMRAQRTHMQKNHRILSIRHLEVESPVYDLTVPGTQNFALASGVFVHNSKDCADALAGVVFGLTMRREVWARYGVPIANFIEGTERNAPGGRSEPTDD